METLLPGGAEEGLPVVDLEGLCVCVESGALETEDGSGV